MSSLRRRRPLLLMIVAGCLLALRAACAGTPAPAPVDQPSTVPDDDDLPAESSTASPSASAAASPTGSPSAMVHIGDDGDFAQLLDNRELCAKGTVQVASSGGPDSWQSDGAVDLSEWSDEFRAENSGSYFEQESLHPNYRAQLAMRSCIRQLYAGEQRAHSTCVRSGTGLTSRGEPVVSLQ